VENLNDFLNSMGPDPDATPQYFYIGPEEATLLLSKSKGNRKLRQTNIQSLAHDMTHGVFYPGADCLIIDENGDLKNGHHRLHAIIVSGKTIKLLIRNHVPEQEVQMIDCGAKRTLTDRTCFMEGANLTSRQESVLRAAVSNGWQNKCNFSNADLIEFAERHKKALKFATEDCFQGKTTKGVASAVVLSVFFRASYHEDKDQLRYAANWLLNGYAEELKPGYKSLQALRDWLLKNPNSSGSSSGRNEIYRKTTNLLYHFLRGKDRDKATATKEDYFPIDLPPSYANYDTDVEFSIYLRKFAKNLNDKEIVCPKEVGIQLYESGYQVKTKNPVKNLANKFSKKIRDKNGILEVPNLGIFKINELKGDRVKNYIFLKVSGYKSNDLVYQKIDPNITDDELLQILRGN
jgi:hypothetical protein